jgi:KaiC/GvpD/RAD55 family RecA-like ATPase
MRYAYYRRAMYWGSVDELFQTKDQTLFSLWESVRRLVLTDRANGGRSRVVGDNLSTYAESLRSEMDRRELKYASISSTE